MNSNTSQWLVLTRNFVADSHPQNDSGTTTTYRDAVGRTLGTASETVGRTTFRDSSGRTLGTAEKTGGNHCSPRLCWPDVGDSFDYRRKEGVTR